MGTSPQLAKTAKVFASTSELERKRKAEQSMADQIAALREMVLQLIKGQAEQKTRFEEQEARYTEEIQKQAALLKELVKESQGQQRSTTALEATVAKSVRKPSYSEVAKGDHTGTPRKLPGSDRTVKSAEQPTLGSCTRRRPGSQRRHREDKRRKN